MKIKKFFKYAFISFLVIFIAFIAIRVFMSSDRSALNEVHPTEAAILAYENKGEAAFSTCKIPHDMSNDGYFTAYALSYCENVGELQITVRYNESLPVKYLPDTDTEKYYYELRDKDGNTVSKATVVAEKERYFYRHFRLSFEDVKIDEQSELYLFLCCDEASYPADHTKGILVAHPSFSYRKLDLSKDERAALSEDKK